MWIIFSWNSRGKPARWRTTFGDLRVVSKGRDGNWEERGGRASGYGGREGKLFSLAKVNVSRVEAPVKLNCRKTLFLFLVCKHPLTSLILSPILPLICFLSASYRLSQSRFLSISVFVISLFIHCQLTLPLSLFLFLTSFSLFIPFLLSVFAQLTRVSICFIKLRRFHRFVALFGRYIHHPLTVVNQHPSSGLGPSRGTFLSKWRNTKEGVSIADHPKSPATLSYKFNGFSLFLPSSIPSTTKSSPDVLTNGQHLPAGFMGKHTSFVEDAR